MAAIEIPADYWTVRPRGFVALVGPYSAAFGTIAGDVGRGADALAGGDDAEMRRQLGELDADAADILAAAATEYDAVTTTPTGDVLAGYETGDRLTRDADRDVAATGGIVVTDPAVPPPPGLPGDDPDQPTPPPDVTRPPDDRSDPLTAPGGVAPGVTTAPAEGSPASASTSGAGGADGVESGAAAISPVASAPAAGEQPENPAAPPPPIYVTRDELAALLDHLSPLITVMV